MTDTISHSTAGYRNDQPGTRTLDVNELMSEHTGYESSPLCWIDNMLQSGMHDDSDGTKFISHYYALDKDKLAHQAASWLSEPSNLRQALVCDQLSADEIADYLDRFGKNMHDIAYAAAHVDDGTLLLGFATRSEAVAAIEAADDFAAWQILALKG